MPSSDTSAATARQTSGQNFSVGEGGTGCPQQADLTVVPAPAAEHAAAADPSGDDWGFVVPSAAQKGSGATVDSLPDQQPVSLANDRQQAELPAPDPDCDAELIIPCGATAGALDSDIILRWSSCVTDACALSRHGRSYES